MWPLIGIITVSVALIAVGILYLKRQQEMKKYYRAAYMVLKESYLNDALKRNNNSGVPQIIKLMVYIKNLNNRKECFVFDPQHSILIGRIPEQNTLCVRDMQVSGIHCRIFQMEGTLFLEDLASTNGTWLRHGLSKKRVLQPVPIAAGDRLYIGTQRFKMIPFLFNTMFL